MTRVALAYLERKLAEEQAVLTKTEQETKEAIEVGKRAQRRLDAAQDAVDDLTEAIMQLTPQTFSAVSDG